jgi:hypothetical protein
MEKAFAGAEDLPPVAPPGVTPPRKLEGEGGWGLPLIAEQESVRNVAPTAEQRRATVGDEREGPM